MAHAMSNRATREAQLGGGLIPPSVMRPRGDAGHQQPHGRHWRGRIDSIGGVWHGHSRGLPKARRRKANKRSWAKTIAQARRDAIAANREGVQL
jgi:hypothetical protein